jgi:hypothetical protein
MASVSAPLHDAGLQSAVETYAIVRPAKTPPAKTSAMAMPRYSQSCGFSGDLGRSSSGSLLKASAMPPNGMGSAVTIGAKAWKRPMKTRRAVRSDEPLPGRERAALMAMAISERCGHLGAEK